MVKKNTKDTQRSQKGRGWNRRGHGKRSSRET